VGANNIEVALYPCGGGNDFIKCFGAQQDFQSFDAVVNGSPIAIDVLKVNHTYCVNLMSVGVDADVNAGIIKYRKVKAFRGPMAYNLSLVEHLMKPMGKDLILDLGQDLQLEENLILVAAGNGRVYGGGYYATPEARLDDGIIDVVTVGKMPLLRVAKVLGIYKKGDHLCAGEVRADIADKVSFFRTNRLRIRSAQEFVVNIDGESSTSNDLEIQVLKHAVQFVLPPGITYN
jgi:diacylglycerol kinase (ATP)